MTVLSSGAAILGRACYDRCGLFSHNALKYQGQVGLIERINTHPIKKKKNNPAKSTPSSIMGRTKQAIEREVITEQHHKPVRPGQYPWGAEALKSRDTLSSMTLPVVS